MATEINIADLTNGAIVNQEWQGIGVFDTLIAAVNKNIEIQFNKGRITGSNYADVYLGSMQAVLQQSVEFLLRKDLTEAQIDSEMKNIELKTAQLAAERNKTEAELEKQWGYDVTRDANGELVLGTSTGNGKVDKDIEATIRQTLAIDEEIALKERQIVDQELTSAKQRTILDTEEQAKQYEADYLQPAQLAQLQKQTDVVEREMVEKELTGVVQRQATQDEIALKERQVVDQELTSAKQRTLLDTQEQAEQYKVDNILPKELAQITAQVAVLELQDDELNKKVLILEEQRKAAKAEVVIKDKEAAKLGLDNVVKNAETERAVNSNMVYTPRYGV